MASLFILHNDIILAPNRSGLFLCKVGDFMEASLMQYFITQGPFAVLFVWLFYSSRKESQEREKKLYDTIDDQNEILKGFSSKYDIIINKLDDIEDRIPQKESV